MASRIAFVQHTLTTPDLPQPPRQQHDWHELVVLLRGSYRVRVDGHDHCLQPGAVVCYPAGCAHEVAHEPSDLQQHLLVLGWHDEEQGWSAKRRVIIEDRAGRISLALRWLADLMHAKETDLESAHSLLQLILAEHRRLCSTDTESNHGFAERIEAWMRSDLHRPLSMLELARSEGLSIRQLQRRYRAARGCSPSHTLLALRLERARNLLAAGMRLSEVAPLVGYSHPRALARCLQGRA